MLENGSAQLLVMGSAVSGAAWKLAKSPKSASPGRLPEGELAPGAGNAVLRLAKRLGKGKMTG